jgi:hypothetical protein
MSETIDAESAELIDPAEAAARIRRVRERVDAGRKGHAALTGGVALALLAYFALLGHAHYGHSHSRVGLSQTILVAAPTVCVLIGQQLWHRYPGTGARRLDLLESRVLTVSAALTLVAGVLAMKLAHPFPSMLAGVLPAAPWLLLSRRTARS